MLPADTAQLNSALVTIQLAAFALGYAKLAQTPAAPHAAANKVFPMFIAFYHSVN